MMTLDRAIRDLRWYAERLCVDKPERYEVYQTAGGVETKLSDAVRVVLAEAVGLREAAERAVAAYFQDGPPWDIREDADAMHALRASLAERGAP